MPDLSQYLLRPLVRLGCVFGLLAVASRGLALVWIELRNHPLSERLEMALAALTGVLLISVLATRRGRSVVGWLLRRVITRPVLTSHGTARWGTGRALRSRAGLLVGRSGRHVLRVAGEGHVLTVAPTGSGKGVSSVIPNLLTYAGSILVTDPKGENYTVTARRRREMGHRVLALDPFGLVGGDASFNPLDGLDVDSPDAVDDAMLLADMLVIPSAHDAGDQAFWNDEARALLAGVILHIAASETRERRTLATVWEALSKPPRELTKLWGEMGKSEAVGGAVSRAAARIRQKADRVRAGILTQAQSHAHFLESPRLAHVMRQSSFRFEELKTGRVTVHLVLPPDRLDTYRRWLRLMIGCGMQALTRSVGLPAERVLVLLDEFPALGPMAPVERAVSLLRGYGVRVWVLVQDLSQLKTIYPDAWPTFLANAEVLQAFGANEWETADYLSRMTGESTVLVQSEHRSRGASRGVFALAGTVQSGDGLGVTERGRRLLFADEVRRLPREQALLFVKGADPLLVRRVNYLTDREFRGQFDGNPMHSAVRSIWAG